MSMRIINGLVTEDVLQKGLDSSVRLCHVVSAYVARFGSRRYSDAILT